MSNFQIQIRTWTPSSYQPEMVSPTHVEGIYRLFLPVNLSEFEDIELQKFLPFGESDNFDLQNKENFERIAVKFGNTYDHDPINHKQNKCINCIQVIDKDKKEDDESYIVHCLFFPQTGRKIRIS